MTKAQLARIDRLTQQLASAESYLLLQLRQAVRATPRQMAAQERKIASLRSRIAELFKKVEVKP